MKANPFALPNAGSLAGAVAGRGLDTLEIKDKEVTARSPEGKTAHMPLVDWMNKVAPRRMDTCDVILPDGIKAVFSQGPATVWIHQSPPRLYNFRWIADDSPSDYGPGTLYRPVRLALPYVIVLAVFRPAENGQLQLCSASNECFFRNQPLDGPDAELYYPALLNCSKFKSTKGFPLSWICTQNMDRSAFVGEPDFNRRLRLSFQSLMHCLFETAFNRSSERHEGASWYHESRTVDPRIADVNLWQEESARNPLFVLDLPWLKTGLGLRQMVQRTFQNLRVASRYPVTASGLARFVFNHRPADKVNPASASDTDSTSEVTPHELF